MFYDRDTFLDVKRQARSALRITSERRHEGSLGLTFQGLPDQILVGRIFFGLPDQIMVGQTFFGSS